MGWLFQNPNTGEEFEVAEQYDEESGTDINREKMISKGFTPIAEMRNPKTGEQLIIDDRQFDKMLKKGFMPEQAFQTVAQVQANREALAAEQVKGPKGAAIAAAKGAADFLTSGFSDEIAAAWQSATNRGRGQDFLEAFKQYQDIDKTLSDIAWKEQPVAYGVGALAGIVGGGAAAAKALGAAPTIARAAGVGAVEGAVGGAGFSEKGSIKEFVKDTLIGAAGGGVIGGGVGLIGKGAAKLSSQKSQEAVETAVSDILKREAPDMVQVAESAVKNKANIANEKILIKDADISSFKQFKKTADSDAALSLLNKADGNPATDSAYNQAIRSELEELGEKLTPENIQMMKAYNRTASLLGKVRDSVPGTRSFMDLRAQEGKDFILRQYDRLLGEEAMLDTVIKSNMRDWIPQWSVARKLASKFSDVKPLAKSIDKRLGTNMEKVIDNMSRNHNLYTVRLGSTLEEIGKLKTLTRKAGLSEQDIFEQLDSGNFTDPVTKQWQDFFEKVRQEAVEAGIPISKLKTGGKEATSYVPHRRLGTVRYQRAIADRVKSIQDGAGLNLKNLDDTGFEALSSDKSFDELLREVEFLRGPVKSAEDFSSKLSSIVTDIRLNKEALATDAFASKARMGSIPDFVLDKQAGNLATKWVQSTFRHAALRDGLANLQSISKVADKAGDEYLTKYINNLTADIIGSRTDTVAGYSGQLMDKFLIYAQKKASSAEGIPKLLWEGTAYLPETLNAMARQVYPNYIGLNPKSVIQNLSQPMLMSIPDIGYKSGVQAWAGAQLDIAKVLKDGMEIRLRPEMAKLLNKKAGEVIKTRNLSLVMQNEGMLPKQWTGEMVDALKDSLKSNAVTDMSRKALDKYTSVMMSAFEKSEIYARTTSYFMGRRLAHNLYRNADDAYKFVAQLDSPAYKKSMKKALDNKSLGEFQKQLVEYINSNHMFNYDRMNMSEYGRYLGPMFSVFSKWPTSISGKILQQTMDEGLGKGGKKIVQSLLAPFMALAIVDQLTKPEDSAIYNRVIGRGGFSSWTPIDSVSPLLEGGLLQSPAMQSGGALVKALRAEDKADGTYKWANDFYDTFGVGSGLLRFLGEDIPVYRGEEKPKGPKIERRIKKITGQ